MSVCCAEFILRNLEKPVKLALFEKNSHGTGSYRLKPNLDIRTKVGNTEISIKTNSFGMHWRQVDKENSGKKVRVAFVGDSFTFGCWAKNFQSSFVGAFETHLSKDNYEVLNFGVGGYGLSDIELLLREEISHFHPDYIFLAFFNGNDFRDTYLGTEKYNIVEGAAQWDNRIIEEKLPPEYRTERHLDHAEGPKNILREKLATSRALSRIRSIFLKTRKSINNSENTSVFINEFKHSKQITSYPFWSQIPYPSVADNAREVSMQTLDRIRSFAQSRNMTLLVVSIPYREQVYVEKMAGIDYDLELPQRYVETYAKENDVPYLDLLPLLREYVRDKHMDIYISGDPHFNTRGHRIIGESIGNWFMGVVETGGDGINGGK